MLTHVAPLVVLPDLVHRLEAAGVRYGIFKNVAHLDRAAQGEADFDMLVDVEDARRFRTVMADLTAVRGTCHPLHDNAVPGREDWFVPDISGRALHLDVSFGLRVGPKFHKHYLAMQHGDITEWRGHSLAGVVLPVVSPSEEARIAILRSAFRLPARGDGGWAALDLPAATLIEACAGDAGEPPQFVYQIGKARIACALRLHKGRYEIANQTVRELRAALRVVSGSVLLGRLLGVPSDGIVNFARRTAFAIARRVTGIDPASDLSKRSLLPHGVVIALIGPDGVGKSTQAALLQKLIGRKFRVGSIYLGSNDGSWMAWRGRMSRALPGLTRTGSKAAELSEPRENARTIGYRKALGRAVWRLVIALQRRAALNRCRRIATKGGVVIADRWPQDLRQGYMDGPSVRPPVQMRLPNRLWAIENRIYHRMVRQRPDLTIHLDCDFRTSNQRKPGDISEVAFELRLALMREMRERDPRIKVVDARQDREAVTADLARLVWLAMHHAQHGAINRDTCDG